MTTAQANPNIAFIKYWGDRDPELHLPANSSLSMNLDGLTTRTTVTFHAALVADRLTINSQAADGAAVARVSDVLDQVRALAGFDLRAEVTSTNNFPMGTGIASSASAFAALSLAASTAAGLQLSERDLTRLARRGSGSACRSVPGGFVEWQAGETDQDSYAYSIAPASHWDLVDCIAIVSEAHKVTGSIGGHALAGSSPLQAARVASTAERLDICRRAILERDFDALAVVTELDSNLMHAVMMTSRPPLFYWQPETLAIMQSVQAWRYDGLPVCYTVDAGPNVHVLCPASAAAQVRAQLKQIAGVREVLSAAAGGGVRLESG